MAHIKSISKVAKGDRIIVIELEESDYELFSKDPSVARITIDHAIQQRPELFPLSVLQHYKLNGHVKKSVKTGYRLRTIRNSEACWRIYPSFLLPYMRGKTEYASDVLFLSRWVPFWALAHVFGRNSMYWYRLFQSFSANSIVGTTVQKDTPIPEHLVADEEHLTMNGKKVYCATTASSGCILGAETVLGCSENDLISGYSVFKNEAQMLSPKYKAVSVNLDGWRAGKLAWCFLFPKIAVISCFLHSFIKIRDRALKQLKDVFKGVSEKVWDAYRAENKRSFAQKLRRLKEWTLENIENTPMKQCIEKLCSKSKEFQIAYDHPKSYRTSNTVDRLMKFMNRFMQKNQFFHGKSVKVASKTIRAFALIYNFSPSCPDYRRKDQHKSPVARFNKHIYHENWLANLLIAGSLNGKRQQTTKTL